MKLTAIILLITLLPTLCFAQGKVANIKKGQTAPFDGILLDKEAEATMAAKRESAVKICEIEKEANQKQSAAECNLQKSFIQAELNAEKKKNEALFTIKEAELKRVSEELKKTAAKEDYSKIWFTGGFIAGAGLSIAIFYAASQASR